ncbi:ComF family protein [Photobacterium gaetbulicola]|uniref:Amidophosphoribosyltransferase-like protein n=1 Tax=Photobacterium gaetbulicola Gung47 TaxID=658445 RepID=A0A0C5WQ60_9GAMM|nr:amidophosphoribosyltransferase-like protein [Photobacterium gaetbulicola Gung47]PSU13781.1 ComF family protein [Photobacterium gaetbulicola]
MVSLFTQFTNLLRRYHRCQLCQQPSDGGHPLWCSHCLARFPCPPYCHHCGNTLLAHASHCGQCLGRANPWQRFYRAGEYHFPLRQLIHQLKFQRKFWLAQPLGELLARQIDDPAPLLLPIPLHPLRRLSRGFNQSSLIAQAVAQQTGSRLDTRLLRRQRYTPPQHRLSRAQRQHNLDSAFRLTSRCSLPPHVALVDDVVTTGATVAEAATLLRQHGVARIDIYCLSYTPP